jgi:hypothetical protein
MSFALRFTLVIFLVMMVLPFCEKHFEKNILSQIPRFKKKIQQIFKKLKDLLKIVTIAYNDMEGCLSFSTFRL